MANHKFHGPWRSFVVVDQGSVVKTKPDGVLDLHITNPDGILENGSNHDGKALTGKVEDLGGGEYAIHLAQRLNKIVVRDNEGTLEDDKTVMISSGEVTND